MEMVLNKYAGSINAYMEMVLNKYAVSIKSARDSMESGPRGQS